MPRPKSTHMNGFLLGNQADLARAALKQEKQKREPKPDRGSWWATPMTHAEFSTKCAEVFRDMADSREGRKPPMMNFAK